MADFYIYQIRKDSHGRHIDYVKTIQSGKKAGDATITSRQFVAELINSGKATFKTITKNSGGEWVYGAVVHVIDNIYLTTEPNSTTRDNLGNLPTF